MLQTIARGIPPVSHKLCNLFLRKALIFCFAFILLQALQRLLLASLTGALDKPDQYDDDSLLIAFVGVALVKNEITVSSSTVSRLSTIKNTMGR